MIFNLTFKNILVILWRSHTCDRVAMLQLEIWSHNWRFFIDIFDACFYCLLMFSFCLFRIEPTASHFNIYCLHFCLISSVSYDE